MNVSGIPEKFSGNARNSSKMVCSGCLRIVVDVFKCMLRAFLAGSTQGLLLKSNLTHLVCRKFTQEEVDSRFGGEQAQT